jgi:nucleoside-diphosphate-sugar epimerase
MRVFICGKELGLGFVIARKLLTARHKVSLLTGSEDLLPNLAKNGMNPVLGEIEDAEPQRALAKADAVIDAELPLVLVGADIGINAEPPLLLFRKNVRIARLRPLRLRNALRGSKRTLIVTSHAAVLGDTGPVPLAEDARPRPLRGYAWVPRLEREILGSRGMRTIVVRPAWLLHGRGCQIDIGIANWIRLAWRCRRGKYIGAGENCYSAVHLEDLAELYCIALSKAQPRTIIHAASENLSIKELALSIHRAMQLKGQPSSFSLDEARRFTPIADTLTLSHALSGDFARRTLGWQPSHDSILKTIAGEASIHAWAARNPNPQG